MTHVLIFAKTPYHKTPYDQWLAGTEVEPLLLIPEEYAAGYRHMPNVHAFRDYDTNQLVEKTALSLAQGFEVGAVFARAEADVIRAAQLRDILDIQGQRTASALAFRDKVVMKDHLVGGTVEIPTYRQLDSAYTAVRFVGEHGYPVVIKPVSESGSLGARVIRDETELDCYLAAPWRGTSQIETFIPGQMYHIDGLVVNGELAFIHPFRYLNDCLSFRSDDWVANLPLTAQDPLYDRLVKSTVAILGELPTPRNTAFHAELWHTPDDRMVFCEIASRTGGGVISSVVQHAFGLDLDKAWLYAECGLPSPVGSLAYRPAGGLCIPPARGVLEKLPGDGPTCIQQATITGAVGQEFRGGVKSGLFLAGYVVGGDTEDDVAANIEEVAAWFAKETKWRPAESSRGTS